MIGGLIALKDGYDRSRRGFICVQTYNDLNGNGARDSGEGPLPGWTFSIATAAGSPAAQGVTDAKGRFCNDRKLAPGAYRVSQAAGGGWVNTEPGGATPNVKTVTLPPDRSVVVLFGDCSGDRCGRPATPRPPVPPAPPPRPGAHPPPSPQSGPLLQFQKVVQSNAPGGGYPLTGLTFGNMFEIFHSCQLGSQTYTNVTDVPGGSILPMPGHTGIPLNAVCTVTETPPAGTLGWAPCPTGTGHWAQATISPQPLTMAPGVNVVTVTNKFVCDAPPPTAGICITKYHDLNGNGIRDTGEPLLPGWIFSVKTSGGTMMSFGTTGAQGQFCTPQTLPAGGYNIFETPQSGWTSTNPGGTYPTKAVTLTASQLLNVDFGNRTPRVCVTKYNDLNGNGNRNTSDPGLPGWTFSVKNSSGVILDSGVTDAQGQWCTTQPLPVGGVQIVETTQTGWFSTDPGGASPTKSVTLVAGQTKNVVFGNWMPPSTGKVCVIKFQDLNSNGVYDSFEPYLSGWSFQVTGPSGPFSLTTGASGKACTSATLAQGVYAVVETMQAGWTSTTPGGLAPQRTVTVTPSNGNDLYFGNVKALAGQICVEKYQETIRNNRFDPSEPPLPGWTFKVTNASGVVVATGVTNSAGRWCSPASPALPPGTYTVTEVQQPGWAVTQPLGPPIVAPPYSLPAIVNAVRGADLHFGNIRSGRACITKYNDLNANGQRDPGEPPIAGVQFRGRYGSWVSSYGIVLTTDANGMACADLPPGPGLQFDETMQPGWTSTEPVGIPVSSAMWVYRLFTIVEGQTTNLMFGNHKDSLSGRICINKFNDLNGDGVKQGNEPLLPFWTFNITGPSGPLTGSTSYNNGQWCTPQTLLPGTYQVTETAKPGWVRTKPGGTAPQMPVAVTIGQTTTLTVGNHLTASPAKLCVTKYNDQNHNGVRDAGEPVMSGWTFSVFNAAGGLDDTGFTSLAGWFGPDPNGVWCSTQPLAAGMISVVETLNPGWVSTSPGGTVPTRSVVLMAGQTTNLAFGNYHVPPAPGAICVTKFNDLNGDGVRQAGEPLMAGWNFNLTGPSGPLSGSTDAVGRWCTPQTLTPGNYTVTETPVTGWVNTAPGGSAAQIIVTVPAGQTVVAPFGNHLVSPPAPGGLCVVKFNDLNGDGVRQAGEPLLGGWQFSLAGPSGPLSGTTNDQAGQWCTKNTLAPGTYTVSETMKPGWISTTPGGTAPQATILVASGQFATVLFGNQKVTPPVGQVCVTKYNDLNVNGQRNAGDPTMAGWQMSVRNGSGALLGQGTTDANGQVCFSLPPGVYQVVETLQPGWGNSDPSGAFPPHKPVTVVNGQTTNVLFGNYQPARIRFAKVVLSNAPGGGFPLTGLTFGNSFQIAHHCVLGNASGGNVTNVPANGIAPMAGYTGSQAGSVCTITETPPPGIMAWAPCPTGAGHWATPIIASTPLTLQPGMNEITVTNAFVCENPPPPPPPVLTIEKFVDLDCGGAGLTNPCVFRIRIRNTGTGSYAGPVTFTDSVNFQGLPQFPGATVLIAPLPTGWGCTGTSAPVTCTGNVNLGAGQWVDVILTMNLAHPVMPSANCARITAPVAAGPSCVPIDG